jgi:urease subunit beta/urease subunit gamma/beta
MVVPGEWLLCDEPIEINAGRRTLRVSVRNTGDRPIQIGSHFHFFEVNRVLDFDRLVTLGMRLDVPSGQSIRFEPGDERDVDLVEFGGMKRVVGFNSLLDGSTSARWSLSRAIERASALGFAGMPHPEWPAVAGRSEPPANQGKDRQAVRQ